MALPCFTGTEASNWVFCRRRGVAWFTLADGFMDRFNWVVRNRYKGVFDGRPRLYVYCLSSHHIDYPIDCIPQYPPKSVAVPTTCNRMSGDHSGRHEVVL